jgi:hypothetical protein
MDRPPRPAKAARPISRQLALPLPPVAPLAPDPPAAPPLPAPVCPTRVWAGLPPTAQAQLRRTMRQVFEEVVRDERRTGQP